MKYLLNVSLLLAKELLLQFWLTYRKCWLPQHAKPRSHVPGCKLIYSNHRSLMRTLTPQRPDNRPFNVTTHSTTCCLIPGTAVLSSVLLFVPHPQASSLARTKAFDNSKRTVSSPHQSSQCITTPCQLCPSGTTLLIYSPVLGWGSGIQSRAQASWQKFVDGSMFSVVEVCKQPLVRYSQVRCQNARVSFPILELDINFLAKFCNTFHTL